VSRVAIIFTGGTISMISDPVAGGNVPALDGAAILERTPGLERFADVVAIDIGRTPASRFSFPGLFEIAGRIREAQADPTIDGVVVVQGTDTIEETAFLWDLVLDRPEPVVVTGAMRTSSEPAFDGPANLRDAVACAASPALSGAGVVVVLAGSIDAADAVTKTHATALDTFKSLDGGRLGTVADGAVELERPRGPRRHVATDRAAEDVFLITAHVAMDGALLNALAPLEASGVVIAATGAGNTSPALLESARRLMAAGTIVALTTRAASGAATPAYAFEGGGATWVRAGAILAGHLNGPKTRVALAAGLGAALDRTGLAELLADPIADSIGKAG
jgi:L-asparaginase